MAFKIKRGLVLRTTRAMKIDGQSVAKGTRVKAMRTVDKDTLQVKVKDSAYPKLAGTHTTLKYSDVAKVERGRPASEEDAAPKAAAKKAPAKKAAKKTTAKKTAAKKAPTAPAAPATEPAAPTA